MYCPGCGKKISDDSSFCGYCGKSIASISGTTIETSAAASMGIPGSSLSEKTSSARSSDHKAALDRKNITAFIGGILLFLCPFPSFITFSVSLIGYSDGLSLHSSGLGWFFYIIGVTAMIIAFFRARIPYLILTMITVIGSAVTYYLYRSAVGIYGALGLFKTGFGFWIMACACIVMIVGCIRMMILIKPKNKSITKDTSCTTTEPIINLEN